jgi:hypothetical protein
MSRKPADLTNQRFERLVVLERAGSNKHGASLWLCRCDCGVTKIVHGNSLKAGLIRSCGCLSMELRILLGRKFGGAKAGSTKHGHTQAGNPSPTYCSWQAMKYRCLNSKSSRYLSYGGANPPVTICDRWLESFENFLADLGERPPGTTLGRYMDTGNYEVGNVSWQTPKEQWANHSPARDFRGSFKKPDLVAA